MKQTRKRKSSYKIKKSLAYVINLDTYKERWKKIQEAFKNSSIRLERFDAVKKGPNDADHHTAVAESFKGVIRKAKENNMKTVLIFEDDNKPLKDFDKNWNIIKKSLDKNLDKWDIFYGGARFDSWGTNTEEHTKHGDSTEILAKLDNNVYLCKVSEKLLGANWIYINSSAYDKLLEYNREKGFAIDFYMSDYNIFKVIFSIPHLALQEAPAPTNSTNSKLVDFKKVDPFIIKHLKQALEKAKKKEFTE